MKSRKLNVTCVFICHRYFCIDRLLRNDLDYIIFTKLDKNEINMIYNDISLDVDLKAFQKINNDLKQYNFILIDKYNENNFMKIRKNLNLVLIYD